MLDGERRERYFQRDLGGQVYWNMLLAHGLARDEVRELLAFHAQNRHRVVGFMGKENYEALSGGWREPMFALSTLRYLCDWLGCWKPTARYADVGVPITERFVREEEEVPHGFGEG